MLSPLPSGRTGRRAVAVGVAAGLVVATAFAQTESLAAVCERLRTGDNDYFSDRLARATERKGVLARERIKLGDPETAIRLLDEGLAEVSAAGGTPSRGLIDALEWNLVLALIQLAEDQNCIAHHSASSCLLPVTGDGVHTRPQAARRAGDLLIDYIADHPRNVQAAWLLNIVRQVSGDWPDGVPENLRLPEDALRNESAFPRWRDRAPELGLASVDLAGGAVMDDFDGDGLLDLVATTWDPCDSMKAFRNDGRGGFEDVSSTWGLAEQWGGLNLVQADFDGDGRRGSPGSCLRQRHGGLGGL